MKSIENYVDDLKEKTGSDYKSAKELMVDRSCISNIRKRGQVSDEIAIRIADTLGIDRSEVLLAATIARSDGEVKRAWEKISLRSGMTALFLFYVFDNKGFFYLFLDSMEAAKCILCKIYSYPAKFIRRAKLIDSEKLKERSWLRRKASFTICEKTS